MRNPKPLDYLLLGTLSLIWASAFFNIKIATYSFGPVTIAFFRIFLGAIPVVLLCLAKRIKIEAFSKDWLWFASIGFINLVIPFFLIAYGVQKVQSNLAAILMATTPLSATILAHFFTENEKFNWFKSVGILIGFSGIVFLFSDKVLINTENILYALAILLGSTCYVIGGILTLKISKKKNENVTASILIWGSIIVFPISMYFEQPWNLSPSVDSMIALLYLFMVPENVKIPCVVLYSYTAPGECTKSSFALLIRATQFLFFFKCQELIKHSLNTFHKDYEDINSLYT